MRTLMRWAARLYPATWRNRYAAEFDALLEDISPSLGDLCDVLGHVLRVRATTSIDACLVLAPESEEWQTIYCTHSMRTTLKTTRQSAKVGAFAWGTRMDGDYTSATRN